MHSPDNPNQTQRHRHAIAAGAATRETMKRRAEQLAANPINWEERITRLREILDGD